MEEAIVLVLASRSYRKQFACYHTKDQHQVQDQVQVMRMHGYPLALPQCVRDEQQRWKVLHPGATISILKEPSVRSSLKWEAKEGLREEYSSNTSLQKNNGLITHPQSSMVMFASKLVLYFTLPCCSAVHNHRCFVSLTHLLSSFSNPCHVFLSQRAPACIASRSRPLLNHHELDRVQGWRRIQLQVAAEEVHATLDFSFACYQRRGRVLSGGAGSVQ